MDKRNDDSRQVDILSELSRENEKLEDKEMALQTNIVADTNNYFSGSMDKREDGGVSEKGKTAKLLEKPNQNIDVKELHVLSDIKRRMENI